MSCRPLVLRVLTLRCKILDSLIYLFPFKLEFTLLITQQNTPVIQKTTIFQHTAHNVIIHKCFPCVFVSFLRQKTRELMKRKKPVEVELWKGITIKELADIFKSDVGTVISYIPKNLVKDVLTENTKVESLPLLILISSKFGKKETFKPNPNSSDSSERNNEILKLVMQLPSKPENLVKRPPVVTIMGHVDHGKTTLLDALRNTFVVKQEFGGITQHIGAFSVEVKPGEKITFIDTPGHAAFTTLRSRGAEVTDLVVLVIAADDGVMDQTVESINIATRAEVPMIVAVNKIDKPTALTLDQIKEKLLMEGIQVEDKGGNVQLVAVSALKKINLDVLVEVILVEAEMMDLKGDPTGLVEGVIIESKTDKKGKQATVIIKRGTLKKGKIIVAGTAQAKVRVMFDENGKEQERALPSTPVQVLGWKELPAAGETVFEVKSEKVANKLISLRKKEDLEKKMEEDRHQIEKKSRILKEEYLKKKLEFSNILDKNLRKQYAFENFNKEIVIETKENRPQLNLIVKSDVHGSLEVILDVIKSYSQSEECILNVIEGSVGDVKMNDIELAESSGAAEVLPAVKEKTVDIRYHKVLYRLIDDLKNELTARIPPKDVEEVLGEAEVIENFFISVGKKKYPVAGSKCVKGELKKKCLFKVIRNDEVIFNGNVETIRHLKTEVEAIRKNTECGLMFSSFPGKFEPGDKIVCYQIIQVPQKTSWDPGF